MKNIWAVFLALFACSGSASANVLDLLGGLHFRHSVNSVYFDGQTCQATPYIWNAPSAGNVFFIVMSIAIPPTVTNRTLTLLYAVGQPWTPVTNPDKFYIDQLENPDGQIMSLTEYEGELNLLFWGLNGANHVSVSASTLTRPIAHNGKYQTFAVYVDTWNLTAQFINVEEEDGAVSYGQMAAWENNGPDINGGPPGAIISWDSVTNWYVGCNGPAISSQPWNHTNGNPAYWFLGNMNEQYLDLNHEWILPTALGVFVSEQGYLYGLSQVNGDHDCTAPWNGQYTPNGCNTGNPNFFPNGPFPGPAAPGYVLNTISGQLGLADHDACLMEGIGDGCLGP